MRISPSANFGWDYDIAPDSKRVLVNRAVGGGPNTAATIVVNWQAEVGSAAEADGRR